MLMALVEGRDPEDRRTFGNRLGASTCRRVASTARWSDGASSF